MNFQSKALVVFCGLLLAGVGCAPPNSDSPIRLLGARPLHSGTAAAAGAATCEADAKLEQLEGRLDISASQQYLIAFGQQSDLQKLSTTVQGEVLAGPNRNDFIADQMIFQYSSVPARPFEAETKPIYAVIAAGSNGSDGWISLDLLAPKAAALLASSLSRGDSLQLNATFQLSGALVSGQKLKSNTITFPIAVFNSGFTGCPAGDIPAPTGPCGGIGGQDGSPVGCCSNPTFASSCGKTTP